MDFLAALSQIGRDALRAAADAQTRAAVPKKRKVIDCGGCASNAFIAKIHGHEPSRKPRKKAR